jgi:plastocyanin
MIDTRVPAWRAHLTAVALVGLLLALTGCSSSGGSGTTSTTTRASATAIPSGGGSRIIISDFKFSPPALTVKPGARVEVLNQDTTTHTVTATGSAKFNTGNVAPGQSATFTAPTAPGTYPYICTIHQFMKGTLTVR